MAATVTWEGLRELATFRAENGCAISMYLDLDPSVSPTPDVVHTRVNALLDEVVRSEIARRPELTHEQKQGLRDDVTRLSAFFESDFSREGSHGYAVYCAGLDNVWQPLPLSERVRDLIKVGRTFYLAPLVPLIGLRDVAATLQRLLRRLRRPRVVVVASEETRAELEEELSSEVKEAIIGWAAAEAHANPAQLLRTVAPLLERWRAEQETSAGERWRGAAGRNGRAAAGWAQTLEAASDGRVELLLFHDGTDHRAWECPACGRVAAEAGTCPLDGTQMEENRDGLDLAVHQTLAHGGTVWALRQRNDLEPVEGIGAVLRY